MNNTFLVRWVILFSLFFSTSVYADNSFYVTGGLGYGLIEYTEFDSDLDLQYAGRSAGKIGLGFQFTPEFALETNYQYYFSKTDNTVYPFTFIDQKLRSHAYVINLLGVVRVPITSNQFNFLVKLGPGYTSVTRDLDTKVNNTRVSNISNQSTGTSLSYSAGIEYDFTPHFGIIIEYLGSTLFSGNNGDGLQIHSANREQLNSIMGSAIWRF